MSNWVKHLDDDEIEMLLEEDYNPNRFLNALTNALSQLENADLEDYSQGLEVA